MQCRIHKVFHQTNMAREFTLEVWLLTRSIHGVVLYSGARQNRFQRYQLIPANRNTLQTN
jgi:hypothetical protein